MPSSPGKKFGAPFSLPLGEQTEGVVSNPAQSALKTPKDSSYPL